MTPDQLKGITDRARRIEANKPPNLEWLVVTKDIPAMIAEIKRLTAEVERLKGERDSATSVVEWRPSDQRVFLDGVSLRVVYQTGGLWMWSVYWPLSHRTEQGQVATEEEAKSAAIAAAKEMKP